MHYIPPDAAVVKLSDVAAARGSGGGKARRQNISKVEDSARGGVIALCRSPHRLAGMDGNHPEALENSHG